MLELNDVTVAFKDGQEMRTVLDHLEFTAKPGEMTFIVGESGSGKSTLLSVAAGLIQPDSGSAKLNGEVVDTSSNDGQMELYNWSNSAGLRYQVKEVRKCLMENRITSSVHGPEKSILMVETITKLMNDIGSSLNGMTARDFEFKPL